MVSPNDANPPGGSPAARLLPDAEDLLPAERELLRVSATGETAAFGKARPTKATAANRIRARVLREFCFGGQAHMPVHEHGVLIEGAWIEGDLDLAEIDHIVPLALRRCVLDGRLLLTESGCATLDLEGSYVRGIRAEALRATGNLILSDGFLSEGQVYLFGATIEGYLSLDGGRIAPRPDRRGEVPACALMCDSATVGRTITLRNGFSCVGSVRLVDAVVRGNLDFTGASMTTAHGNPGDDTVVDLADARIEGNLVFRKIRHLQGSIDLIDAQLDQVVDDMESWRKARAVRLNGCCYSGFSGTDTPIDLASRLEWLGMQRPGEYGATYWPQPYEQLQAAFKDMGYEERARRTAIEKQRYRRRSGAMDGWLNRVGHYCFGLLMSYGYSWQRLLVWVVALWAVGAVLYHQAASFGLMAPTAADVFESEAYAPCRPAAGGNWTDCQAPLEYSVFHPAIYSLDQILPVIELGQALEWRPMITAPCTRAVSVFGLTLCPAPGTEPPRATSNPYTGMGVIVWLYSLYQEIFGWIAGLLAVAVVTGMVKQE